MIHFIFDVLATVMAITVSQWFRKKHQLVAPLSEDKERYYWYLLVAIIGLVFGAFLFGTLNVYLSNDFFGIGRSFLGGLFGAILTIEVYKNMIGHVRSTGLYFIPGICVLIVIGRMGCFLTGFDDFTYGIQTNLRMGYDFGDGVKRHPVQLYESVAIFLFLLLFFALFKKNRTFWAERGFYVFIFYYALQRFIWEFLKPYQVIIGNLNVFHILTIVLMLWSIVQLFRADHVKKK